MTFPSQSSEGFRFADRRTAGTTLARLPQQFDLIVDVDRTRTLEPLERWARHEIDLPETYPTGV